MDNLTRQAKLSIQAKIRRGEGIGGVFAGVLKKALALKTQEKIEQGFKRVFKTNVTPNWTELRSDKLSLIEKAYLFRVIENETLAKLKFQLNIGFTSAEKLLFQQDNPQFEQVYSDDFFISLYKDYFQVEVEPGELQRLIKNVIPEHIQRQWELIFRSLLPWKALFMKYNWNIDLLALMRKHQVEDAELHAIPGRISRYWAPVFSAVSPLNELFAIEDISSFAEQFKKILRLLLDDMLLSPSPESIIRKNNSLIFYTPAIVLINQAGPV